jgi:hypothetical protein
VAAAAGAPATRVVVGDGEHERSVQEVTTKLKVALMGSEAVWSSGNAGGDRGALRRPWWLRLGAARERGRGWGGRGE